MNEQLHIPFITSEQMREVDRAMMDDYNITLLQMMENAGRNLGRLAQNRFLNEGADDHIVVLAGSGGNGGGALVCARYLHSYGHKVQVLLSRPAGAMRDVPLHQLNILLKLGVQVEYFKEAATATVPTLVIDGLIGYSLTGKASGVAAEMISWANGQNQAVLSLDVPSGLDATLGYTGGPVIKATATMTLALPKTGLEEKSSLPYVGELYLADIGVPPKLYSSPALNLDVGPLFSQKSIIRIY
jgi:NAD(P)H-hydrate epimerase